jgi:hypothetical protein
MNAEQQRPIGLISIDAKSIYDRLMKCAVGEIVSYEELNALIGRDVRNGAHYALATACKKAMRQTGAVFGVIRKVGVKRLNDEEIAQSLTGPVERIHRTANAGLRRGACVENFSALPRELQAQHNANLSLLGVMSHFTKGRQITALTARVEKAQATLPLQKTLEAFKEGL